MRLLKPDCKIARQRKAGTVAASLPSSPFSAVRFAWQESRNTGIILLFRIKTREFLRSAERMAERKGFYYRQIRKSLQFLPISDNTLI
jgi:hypothetical protein